MKFPYFLLLILTILIACSEKPAKKQSKSDNIFYSKAFTFREEKKIDSAFLYFYKAKDLFLLQKDSLSAGKCLVNLGIISTDKGDNLGGQEISLSAISYFDQKSKKQYPFIQANYNNLGIATHRLGDYVNALIFFDLAIKFSSDSLNARVYLNNKAKTYQEIKNYGKALNIYDEILRETAKNRIEYARVLSNIAKTKWLQNSNYNAAPQLLKALNIRKNENDEWGQNASYAHLSDYYIKKQPDSALLYALKMYHIAQKLKSPDDQLEALQKLIKLSPPNATKQYFESYQQLADSVQTARNAAKNQFALIRYETEKSKADNLKLQKENTEKKYEVATREFLLAAGFILFIAVSIIAVLWYRKRKQKIESEAQTVIRESQLKTSKKVHDVVANGLYRVMSEMENQEQINKDLVLDRIEDLYKKSRDISYEEPIRANQPFHEKVAGLLKSFATENTHIAIAGNAAELWEKINPKVQYEVENILQELMVNMKKHSAASKVAVRFEQKENQINIFYTDNGLGMKAGTTFNNGLRNTGNRIAGISGAINFDTTAEKGLKIQLSFPIS